MLGSASPGCPALPARLQKQRPGNLFSFVHTRSAPPKAVRVHLCRYNEQRNLWQHVPQKFATTTHVKQQTTMDTEHRLFEAHMLVNLAIVHELNVELGEHGMYVICFHTQKREGKITPFMESKPLLSIQDPDLFQGLSSVAVL